MFDDDNNDSISQLALLRMLQKATGEAASDELSNANPAEFHKIVSKSAESNPMIKANVTPYTPDDYAKFKTFLTSDKQSGYAIKPGHMTEAGADELISVFSNKKGRGNDILKHAVDVGGAKQLDAFDINNKLPSLYGQEFQETSRFKFDPQYAPDDWDYNKLGTPDVIGMKLDNSPGKLVKRTARQAGSALSKFGGPAVILGAASFSDSLDDAITDTLVPGGMESAGMSAEDEKMMLVEDRARKNYQKARNQELRQKAIRDLAGK